MEQSYWHDVSWYLSIQCALFSVICILGGLWAWRPGIFGAFLLRRRRYAVAGLVVAQAIIVLGWFNRLELVFPSLLQAAVVALMVAAAYWLARRRSFQETWLQRSSAAELGWFRIVICVSLLVLAVKDNLLSTLHIPPEFIEHHRPMGWLFQNVGGIFAGRSAYFLGVVQGVTIVSLLCAAVGFKTRLAVICAALFFTIFYYVQMMYTYFYHSGFLSLQLLYALMFMPSGDGCSIDAWRRRKRQATSSKPDEITYSYYVYTLTAVYGLTYFIAALNKWSREPFWALPHNFIRLLLPDSLALTDHVFQSDLVLAYMRLPGPTWVFGCMALLGLLSETAGILLLMHRRLWPLVALLLFSLHTGIYFAQKFIFAELAILPLMLVYPLALRHQGEQVAVSGRPAVSWRPAFLLAAWSSLIACGWLLRWEVFPVATRWAMYSSSSTSAQIDYHILYGYTRAGERRRVDMSDEISFLSVGRWQDAAPFPELDKKGKRRPKQVKGLEKMLRNYAALYNQHHDVAQHLVRFEYHSLSWDFVKDRDDPAYGKLIDRFDFRL